MNIWQPKQAVGVKVIGLAWNNNALLASNVKAATGAIKGVRPLGGSIEFGETREAALHREFLEELGTEIKIVGPWHLFENIFTHEGKTGHEYIFAAEVELLSQNYYDQDEIIFYEADGSQCQARWYSLVELKLANLELYPDGLEKLLISASKMQLDSVHL